MSNDNLTPTEVRELRESVDHSRVVRLSDPDLIKVLRIRLIGYSAAFPQWDLSYCYGQMRDGSRVRVDLDRQVYTREYRRELIEEFRRAGRYAKGMGLFDAITTLHG